MTDTEKDIAAIDIGIQAIERNKAAIEECKKQIDYWKLQRSYAAQVDNASAASFADAKTVAYESILKILEQGND